MTITNENTIEKVIMDENLHYMHLIFTENEGTPEHVTNGNIYMTVVRGVLSIGLSDQELHRYEAGNVLKIPSGTKMFAQNLHKEPLELIIVKSPAPVIN